MLVKEQLHTIAEELPSDASIEDAIEKLILLHKIEVGIKQADKGKVTPHNEVEERVKTWLK